MGSSGTTADGEAGGGARSADATLCMLFNAGETAVEFFLPEEPPRGWRLVFDTSLPVPDDISRTAALPATRDVPRYTLYARALAMLCCV